METGLRIQLVVDVFTSTYRCLNMRLRDRPILVVGDWEGDF